MNKYFYDIKIKGKIETLEFSFLDAKEETESHAEMALNLSSFKDMVGEEEFKKFWTEQDQENAFRKYEGDVKKFCDFVFNPYMVKEVRDESGKAVWKGKLID